MEKRVNGAIWMFLILPLSLFTINMCIIYSLQWGQTSLQLQWELNWYNARWAWESVNLNKYLPACRTIPKRRIYFQWRLVRCLNLAIPRLRINYFNCTHLIHVWSSIPASSSRRRQQRTSPNVLNSCLLQMLYLWVTALARPWVFQEALQLWYFSPGSCYRHYLSLWYPVKIPATIEQQTQRHGSRAECKFIFIVYPSFILADTQMLQPEWSDFFLLI